MVATPLGVGVGLRGAVAAPGTDEVEADAAALLYAGKRLGGAGGAVIVDEGGPPAPGKGRKSAPTATDGSEALLAGGAAGIAPGKSGGRAAAAGAGGALGGAAGAAGGGADGAVVVAVGGRGGIP